jgi:hypothetical protein
MRTATQRSERTAIRCGRRAGVGNRGRQSPRWRFLAWTAVLLSAWSWGCGGKSGDGPAVSDEFGSAASSSPQERVAAGDSETDRTSPSKEQPETSGGWTLDVKALQIPDAPLSGKIHGQEFKPDKVEIDNGMIRIREGEEFFADRELVLFTFLDDGKLLEAPSIEVGPKQEFASFAPHIHKAWTPQGKSFPETQIYTDGYAMKLELDRPQGRKLAGRLKVCLPDDERTYVAGTFTAELPPDYNRPPLAEDAPWIYGQIAIEDAQEFQLSVGYVGETADGQTLVGMAGTAVPAGERSPIRVSSTTHAPRTTTLVYNDEAGFASRLVRLEPGRFLVYVLWDEQYFDWQWVDVAADAQLTIRLAVKPDEAGSLEVTLADETSEQEVELIPLDSEGRLPELTVPLRRLNVGYWLKTKVKPEQGKATYSTLRPGHYRVLAGDDSADVRIVAGETIRMTLPSPD